MTKKNRGAQRGNCNAFKHGFYSAAFKVHERRMLSQIPAADLSGEIELIRVANYRFLQALQAEDASLDVETQLAALRAVNLSAQSITSLLRLQALTARMANEEQLLAFFRELQSTVSEEPSPPPAAGAVGCDRPQQP